MGGQDGCEQRIEVFVKIQKNGGGGVGLGQGGGQVGVRVDVNVEGSFCENSKIIWGGGCRVGGMDVNEELKFLRKFKKKSGRGGLGVISCGGRVCGGFR